MENQIPKTMAEAMNPKTIRDFKPMKISGLKGGGLKGKAPVIREPRVTKDSKGNPKVSLGF